MHYIINIMLYCNINLIEYSRVLTLIIYNYLIFYMIIVFYKALSQALCLLQDCVIWNDFWQMPAERGCRGFHHSP